MSFRGSVNYRRGRDHGGVQAEVVLELRLLHLSNKRKSTGYHTKGNLRKRTQKDLPHSDALPIEDVVQI